MKKRILFLFFAIMLPFAALANPFAPSTPATDSTPVEVEIGNYLYRIPMNYFDLAPSADCNMEATTLLGTIPNFKAHTPTQRVANQTKVDAESSGISVLVHADFKRRDNAPWRLQIAKKNAFEGKNYTKAEYPVYGLDYFYPDKTGKLSAPKDLLEIASTQTHSATLISCISVGGGYHPSCDHEFTVNDLDVVVSYDRQYLYQWQSLEDNVRNFFKQATVRKLDKLKPYCDQTFKLPESMKSKKGN